MSMEILPTPTTPEGKASAAAGHADADALFGKGKDTKATSKPADSDEDDAAEADGQGGATSGKSKGKFKWGQMIAGVLGVGLAWFASSIFGGGWLGTIMFALFAIPAFMMGRSQLGDTIGGWLGEAPSSPTRVASTDLVRGQAAEVDANGQAVATAPTPQLTPAQQMQQEVAEVAEKSQIARATVAQLARTGELTPRRLEAGMRSIARAEQMVQQMQGIDVNRLSEAEMKQIAREFNQAENHLDRMIGQNPILAAQIRQGNPTVSQNPAPLAPQAAAMQPADNVSVNAQAAAQGGPVFVGNNSPQTFVGVMPAEAQLQLMAMRQYGANYQYQQAPSDQYAPPSFNAQPAASPYTVPVYTK